MNKTELVKICSNEACVNIDDTQFIFNIFLDIIKKSLLEGKQIKISEFGTFEPVNKKARTGFNPQTGEKVRILPKKGIRFRPSKKLIEKLNGV